MNNTPIGESYHSDELDSRLASTDDEIEQCKALVAHLRGQVRTDSREWIFEIADRAELHSLSIPTIRSVVADLAFAAREHNQASPGRKEWERAITLSRTHQLVVAYVYGQRLRWDAQFELLRRNCVLWASHCGEDALITALSAVAALGLRRKDGMQLFERALEAPDADARSRHACLAAIWFAHHIPEQAEILLSLSDQMMSNNEDNWTMYFRRASALRKLGRHEEALQSIDRAINALPMGHTEVYQEQIRERELIVSSWAMQQQLTAFGNALREELRKEVKAAADDLSKQHEAAQKAVSDSLLKIVEILGLFIAVTGFLVGTGAVAIKAETFSGRLATMVLILIGSLLFFVMLRFTTTRRSPRNGFRDGGIASAKSPIWLRVFPWPRRPRGEHGKNREADSEAISTRSA